MQTTADDPRMLATEDVSPVRVVDKIRQGLDVGLRLEVWKEGDGNYAVRAGEGVIYTANQIGRPIYVAVDDWLKSRNDHRVEAATPSGRPPR